MRFRLCANRLRGGPDAAGCADEIGHEVRHSNVQGHRLGENRTRNFIFERDEIAYGVEVKNTLGYMNYEEFVIKIALC